MSERENNESPTKQRKSDKTSIISQQNAKQALAAQCPTTSDVESWKAYWQVQDQPWRTEPAIDAERQKFLAERRSIKPNIEQGIYPFKGVKLSRADVEWLLATHENGRGPVDWSDEKQRGRKGLDLRGSEMCDLDLTYLPLARIVGGIYENEWHDATEKQRVNAAVRMQRAKFSGRTHLEGAYCTICPFGRCSATIYIS